ncbi:MAG: deoxyribose-phosphate aldolase [Anaerovoracaceae bacterium]|jgi:deoxyribose-phosphate aldolase
MNKYIDHTNLKADATCEDIARLCREAIENRFYAVCVNSGRVQQAARLLQGYDVKIAMVVGFPLGAVSREVKVFETEFGCRSGADEIDMVMNIGKFKEGNLNEVKGEIKAVVDKAAEYGAIVKVILETCMLTEEEIKTACFLAKEGGAAFVKTSTGFGSAGATEGHISLMRSAVGTEMGVKASGGIRDGKSAMAMIAAGASRIGTSNSIDIV